MSPSLLCDTSLLKIFIGSVQNGPVQEKAGGFGPWVGREPAEQAYEWGRGTYLLVEAYLLDYRIIYFGLIR